MPGAKSKPASTQRARARDAEGHWLPGQSGNPAGREKADHAHVRELARQHTELALNTLVEIAQDKKAAKSSRVAAANSLLDRAWGKPPQALEVGDPNGNPLLTSIAVTLVRPDDAEGTA